MIPKANSSVLFISMVLVICLFLACTCWAFSKDNITTMDSNLDLLSESAVFSRNETITFPSLDELNITADLYLIDKTSPIVLLFHRADWSRGEYLEIAPILNELGYNVMAIDARSGADINGVANKTVERALENELGVSYSDAAVDIEAAIQYAKENLGYENIITWGSSYSASLVIALSEKYNANVKAVLAFAPGEYFTLEDKSIAHYAEKLTIPVFITGAKAEKDWYHPIFEAVASEDKICFVPESDGYHGSQALWKSSFGNQEYWNAVISFLGSLELNNKVKEPPTNRTVLFPSIDELNITADLYLIDKTSPIVLLFHRARWSRGEYLEIAKKLNELGYNAMAIDARSGANINGIENETAKNALEYGLGVTYPDAAVDIEAAIQYAKEKLGYENIITWGSSYSASLVVALSQKYSDNVKAVLAFAPGEYFTLEDKSISDYAEELTIPTFITGAKAEEEWYRPIFEAVASNNKVCFVPESDGYHGSQALWKSSFDNQEYWDAVITFLDSLKLK